MIYLLGGYMWLFIHRPFEVWPWLGALHVERVYMILTILYWALAADKQWISNRLNAAFAFFWIVLLAAWIVSPYSSQGTGTVENYFKVAVFYVLVMSTVRSEKDLKLLLMMFMGAMALYMAHSLREYQCGRGEWRMGTWRMVGVGVSGSDPNSFGATVVYSLPVVFPLWGQFQKSRLRWALVGYVAMAVMCILLTGSRGAFVGLSTLTVIAVLMSKHRVKILVLLAIAAPVVWSLLPEDRQNRYLTLWDPSYGPANAEQSASARTIGIVQGIALWKERPILGFGPGGFAATTGGGQAHNLYGQVLSEMGTLGALAFASIIMCLIFNEMEHRRLARQMPSELPSFPAAVSQAVVVTLALLLVLGWAGHNLFRYTWLWFGAFQSISLYIVRCRVHDNYLEPIIVSDSSELQAEGFHLLDGQ